MLDSLMLELLESEDKILDVLNIESRLDGDHIFFPALGNMITAPDQLSLENNYELEITKNTNTFPYDLMISAAKKLRFNSPNKVCQICNTIYRTKNTKEKCSVCGTPFSSSYLQSVVKVKSEKYEVLMDTDRWIYMETYDLLKKIGKDGFLDSNYKNGMIILSGKLEYRLLYEQRWYLYCKRVKLRECKDNRTIIKHLWKIWEKEIY